MKRRELITLHGGAGVVLPLDASAQQPNNVDRIGVLTGALPESESAAQGFREKLRELGYVQGRNIVIEWRWASGDVEVAHQ